MKNLYLFITILLISLLSCSSSGTASILTDTVRSIPFTETWNSESFSTNGWKCIGFFGNWTIQPDMGNPFPCASFEGSPNKTNYFFTLMSPWFDAMGLICDSIYFDFDLKLENINNTSTEQLQVMIQYDTVNKTIMTWKNAGNIGWKNIKTILPKVHGKLFRLKFVVSGEHSNNFSRWMIDNISITKKCRRPNDFNAWGDLNGDDCLVNMTWSPPDCSNPYIIELIYDYGEPDEGWSLLCSEYWFGNFFPLVNYNIYAGSIIAFEVNVTSGNDSMSVDVFDENRILIGSTPKFLCLGENWVTVNIPPIPFMGPFYAMLHFQSNYGVYLGINNRNSGYNLAWMFLNNEWTLFSVSNLYLSNDSCIWSIRATAEIAGKKMTFISGDSTILQGYNVYRKAYNEDEFVKINQSLVVETTYSEVETNLWPTYGVTAVYENCESNISNTIYLAPETNCWMGVPESSPKITFTISPNPVSTVCEINCDENIEVIRLFDLMGIPRLEEKVVHKKDIQMTVDNFPNGIYFVTVTTKKGTATRKLVISR